MAEAGFSEAMVDSWIEGQNAITAQVTAEVHEYAGGGEAYAQMVQWAADSLPESEVEAYNATMESGNTDLIKFAVQGLHARYRSEAEPTLMQGGTGTVSSGGKFESTAELTAAMSDPRYAKDPAYRQSVADKLAKSSLF